MHRKRILPIIFCVFFLFGYGSITNGRIAPTLLKSSTITILSAVPTRTPRPIIFAGVIGVAFVDAQRGWMLSGYVLDNDDTKITVDATNDGGQTWQVASVLGLRPHTCKGCPGDTEGPGVHELRFTNANDGWAFGPKLLSTHDGGRTWQKVKMEGAIGALEIAGGTIWALQRACTNAKPVQCKVTVLTSRDNAQTWQSSTLVATNIMPGKLVAVDGQTAYILYYTPYEFDSGTSTPEPENVFGLRIGDLHIIATRDGGRTWQTVDVPEPCVGGDFGLVDLAAADRQNLWFACGTEGAGPWGAKRVFTSSDSGKRWQLKAHVDLPEEPDYNISSYGTLRHLFAFSPQSAWMTLYRAEPIFTRDGGKTWQTMRIYPGGGDPEIDTQLTWIDSQHIWFHSAFELFRTRDGGVTWVCLRRVIGYSPVTGCPGQ